MFIYEHKTVKDAIQAIYQARRHRNTKYSLRAFARDLDLSPSTLSEVLSGSGRISSIRVSAVAHRLNLSPEQADYLTCLADGENAKTKKEKDDARKRLAKYSLDAPTAKTSKAQLELYQSWETFTIVEALKLRDSRRTVSWLSEAVGINEARVKELCAILVQHGFILEHRDQSFSAVVESSTSVATRATTTGPAPIPTPVSTIRKMHGKILDQARIALEIQPLAERDISAVIYATSSSKSPEVREAIKNFRRAIMAAGDDVVEKDSVYCLSVQWFKLASAPKPARR